MGITQNGVVWNTKIRARISLCIVNFAIMAKIKSIAKIQFDFSLCTVIFAMIAKFCYHSENMA